MRRLAVALLAVVVAGGLVAVGWWLAAADTEPVAGPPQVEGLRVDHAENPVGVEVGAPRLSWRIAAEERGVEQAAFQIRVASDPAVLSDDAADVWDSGVVDAARPWADYDGPALDPEMRYYWQVRLLDDAGRTSAWSDPAYWETGLADDAAWAADWIGAPYDRRPFEEGNVLGDARPEPLEPDGSYGQTFTASAPFARVEARLSTAEGGAATLSLHAGDADGAVLASQPVEVGEDAWFGLDLPEPVESGEYALVLDAADGDVTWPYHDGDAHGGGTALVDGEPTDGDRRFRTAVVDAEDEQALPLLRHEFSLPDREIVRARLYVSGLGYADVHLNGERVGDHVLDPGFTDYRDTVLYATHDVTGFLRPGSNAVGVALGSGWYGLNTPNPWGFHLAPWHGEPRVRLRLTVDYADGERIVVVSDPAWRAVDGPVRADSVYTGERYDARRAQPGWTEAGFDDSDWEQAVVRDAPPGRLVGQPMEPTKVVDTVEPMAVEEVGDGAVVFDFGRVMSGWARLQVRGAEGTEVRLTYGDRIDDDGLVVTEDDLLGRPLQTDTYVLRGDAQEAWEPAFSVKGFRYVQVEGYPGVPSLEDIEGRTVHAGVAPAGRFESSDEVLTRIHENARRAVAGNLQSVYTADMSYERHAWTGPAQLSAPTALTQFDLVRFFTKWLDDLAAGQRDDGALPRLAPTGGYGYGDPSPAWDGAYILIAWELYERAGDERILERHYEGFTAYLDHLADAAPEGVVRSGLGDLGSPGTDATSPGEDPALVSTAYFFHLAHRVSEIAAVLGEDADAQRYWSLGEEVRAAFNAEFYDPEAGHYRAGDDTGSLQTAQILPLAFGLVPEAREEAVLRALIDDLAARDARLDTGVVGTRFLLPVLTEHGAVDLAYRVASQTEYPSWGHWLEAGVTGMLDRWDLDARSHGHHVFASIGTWLYEDLVGIRPAEPGFDRVQVRPRLPSGLDRARGAVASPRGTIGVSWEQDGERLLLRVTIPPGTRGEVHVPAASRAEVQESGQALWRNPNVAFLRMEGGAAVFEVASGAYEFEAPLE